MTLIYLQMWLKCFVGQFYKEFQSIRQLHRHLLEVMLIMFIMNVSIIIPFSIINDKIEAKHC